MQFEMIDEGEGLVFRISGEVSATGMMEATVAGWQHPAWDRIRYQIWDFTDITGVNMDFSNALAFADIEHTAKRNDVPVRIASIAPDEKMHRICERFSAHARSDSISAKTFDNEIDARAWLQGD